MKNRDLNAEVKNWKVPDCPNSLQLEGRYARLEPLSVRHHSEQIYRANRADDSLWDHMYIGPFTDLAAYQRWVASVQGGDDPVYLAIHDQERGVWGGVASYLRINPDIGVIEVGNIALSPALQRPRRCI